MKTKTPGVLPPAGYDPSQFPAFAVTADVVILTMVERTLNVLLVRHGQEPSRGCGRSRAASTAARDAGRGGEAGAGRREGVDVPSLLTQFGAYGDPGRDPHERRHRRARGLRNRDCVRRHYLHDGGAARRLRGDEDVLALERLLAAGEYRPVIARTYRLEDVVEEHRYVETPQKTGNVVLSPIGGPR